MRYSAASKTALEGKYYRLNSMIACGDTSDTQHLFRIQLEDWKNNEVMKRNEMDQSLLSYHLLFRFIFHFTKYNFYY